jgi:Uma2 family endonuclease
MASNPVTRLTEEQYLAIERAAGFKSEFLNGEMFAMAGTSMQHSRIQMNLAGELYTMLRGKACEAFGSDFRVRVSSSGMYTYPDATVVCGKPILADAHQDNLLNPAVIFEVLSPSTESYDRGLKFQHYRTIESLKDYILVSQSRILIEQFTRQADNTWALRDYQQLGEELKIDSIGVRIPLALIYERVELTPPDSQSSGIFPAPGETAQ